MIRSRLDLIIVNLPKHHKENRKIVNVWTEVARGHIQAMLFKGDFLPSWPSANHLPRSILLLQKAHIWGKANGLVFRK